MDLRQLALKRDRRALLTGATALAVTALAPSARAHNSAGVVTPPEPPPPLELTFHDGTDSTLQAALAGRATALQLMFTSCRATCPLQGALFAEAAQKLGERSKLAQLLSVSIDPGQDTPAALTAWLKRFGPLALRWRAARPRKDQLEAVVNFLKSKTSGPDPHTAQVYYFDRQGWLVLRSVDFPPAAAIVQTLTQLADSVERRR